MPLQDDEDAGTGRVVTRHGKESFATMDRRRRRATRYKITNKDIAPTHKHTILLTVSLLFQALTGMVLGC